MSALLLALVGCYSSGDYEVDYAVAICDKSFECYDESQIQYLAYSTADECISERDEFQTDDEDCVFDPDQAQLCVEETAGMLCADFLGGRWPAPCDLVCGAPDA